MKYSTEDHIVALASLSGQSAIAIVRISGNNALSLLAGLFKGKEKLEKTNGHTLHYGIIYNPETDEKIDDIIIGVYKIPASYTGEDSAELFCHGSKTIIKKIIVLPVKNGIRQAQPGEFTMRDFLNGKIDLTQAEVVNEIIRAKSDKARALALNRLSGVIEDKINSIRKKLITVQAAVEVRIDYPNVDIEENLTVSDQLE